MTHNWCRENLCKEEVWPPSSPDFNLLDFFVLGVYERNSTKSPNNIKLSLIISIREIFINFSRDNISRMCNWFWSRLLEAFAARGNFIC
jgi:hypothetical protein